MSSTSGPVLVTGSTGFIGSHIVSQLLAKGIKVRAAVRSSSKLRKIFPDPSSPLDIVEIPGLFEDYSEALKDVSAVIHTACPAFFNGATNEETFEGIYEGTLSILRQAIASGIKKIIVTGSSLTLFDFGFREGFEGNIITEKNFGPMELRDIKPTQQDPGVVYHAAKTVTDKKMCELAREHSDVDPHFLPSLVLGPLVPHYPLPKDINHLGTNAVVYGLITGGLNGPDILPPHVFGYVVDVRDAAKAHVLALETPPVPGRYKRMIVSSGIFKWRDAVEVVKETHPELEHRLPAPDATLPAQTDAPMDLSFTIEVLGMKEYIPWEKSIIAALEICLEHERIFGA
ncbi:hypothetical protein VNI00_016828 [Paramarasmius palmivorus]|uniref:NAD-dependent epimerase/dehydratase domain-containing protein n=1 Tax=Paramarasmius palmivorus TaxID=297713 RepID=A0AAW0BBE7_9AGAR